MILLDTHVWVWWVQADPRLTASQQGHIAAHGATGLGVSVISCWEVGLLEAAGRITLPLPVGDWVRAALAYTGVRLLDLTPEVAVDSTRPPAPFHRDPADRILVATPRALAIPILTADARILAYSHVRTLT